MLTKKFKDKRLVSVFRQIIGSYHTEQNKGLPIGNLTSQYFANHYLGKLDHFIKHKLKIKAYVRYMDDFIIWHNDKTELKNAGHKITEFLNEELDLHLKTADLNKTSKGLTFIGYRFFPNKILLSKRSKLRFKQKMKDNLLKLENGLWSQEEFINHTTALTAFTEKAYSKKFRKNVLLNTG